MNDDEALKAFQLLSETEGIIPALEPSHALFHAVKRAKEMRIFIQLNLKGRPFHKARAERAEMSRSVPFRYLLAHFHNL